MNAEQVDPSELVQPRGGAFYQRFKRVTDLLIAAVALVVTLPLIVAAAVALRLESKGPIIYRQKRVGLDGRDFEIYKLRTMVDGAEHLGAGLAVDENDARITRVGALLRRTSVDELPNLVNVVRGEMSLVGPRPTVRRQVDAYTPRQLCRLSVKPGIAGWAQLIGRASLPWSERIELDLWYLANRSTKLDFSVFVNNLFNKAYRVYAFDGSLYWGDTLGVYAKPRTWGVSMKYNFGK